MPVTRIEQGCTEFVESKIRGRDGYENRVCGRPIYLDGVCAHCWRCNQQLRGPYTPIQANPAASQIDSVGMERLHVADDTLREKGIERDIEIAMKNFDEEWAELG